MTKEETFSNLKAYLNGDTAIGNIIPLRSVLESALEYLEPSLPSNLDEAAEDFAEEEWDGLHDNNGNALFTQDYIEYAFKAGAEWVAEQGETVDAEVVVTSENGWESVRIFKKLHNVGDKVVVQIRKK